MTKKDFSFAEHAPDFDAHIDMSIPGYPRLGRRTVRLSRHFVQNGTNVVDVGCSTGVLLRAIRDYNQSDRPDVSYVGIDSEPNFREHWGDRRASNVSFKVADARSCAGFENLSLVCSHFTLPFIPVPDKLRLLIRIHDGLNPGGGLIVAEKVYAETALFQHMLTFDYLDDKRRCFSAEEILDKERGLRGRMTCWNESELFEALRQAGFKKFHRFWGDFPFLGVVAVKGGVGRRT